MLNTAGLGLGQAPAMGVPFRFFLAAPLHLLLAGVLLALNPDALGSRWSPALLASVHLIALGFMSQIMLGALLQLLPVVAGISLGPLERRSHWPWLWLNGGVILMAGGFFSGQFRLLALGAVLVVLTLLAFIGLALHAVARHKGRGAVLRGIAFALVALLLALGYGLFLVAALNGWAPANRLPPLVDVHATLALGGWLGLLAMAVSFQLTPLFFITGDFPARFQQWAPLVVLILLSAWAGAAPWGLGLQGILIGLAVVASIYAALFLRLLAKRRRKAPDPAVFHWFIAGACLFLAGPLATMGQGDAAAALLLLGVGVVMPSGTLLKIVPFLCWLHLQNCLSVPGRAPVRLPLMNSFIDGRGPWGQWVLLLFSLAAVLLALQDVAGAGRLAGLFLIAGALLQARLFGGAYLRYREWVVKLSQPSTEGR